MQFEVEQKFRVAGFEAIEKKLGELGVSIDSRFEQSDRYYRHPIRDFRSTDEAFRLRNVGDANCVTYKGPKVDNTTKTRQELELSLPPGREYRERFDQLLSALGFRPVREVIKVRRKAHVPWEGTRVEVSLDEVAGLGTFVELELTASEKDVGSMRRKLQSLADLLGLHDVERRSYLGLLQELDRGESDTTN